MKLFPSLAGALLACVHAAPAAPLEWHFEGPGGVPDTLVWQTEAGPSYHLFQSADLRDWGCVPGFPQAGTGGAMEHRFTPGARGFFRIVAAPPPPDGFVLVPAGECLLGDQSDPVVGYADELPVRRVQVGAFHIARHEVTKELWDEVAAWAAAHDYDVSAAGAGGKGPGHPAHSVTWHECVKWCNARTEHENATRGTSLTPCYTVAGAVYRAGTHAPECSWTADGYRLPTEAEWEKAARGGLVGRLFPWGDTISHADADFQNAGGESYATGATGPHPLWSHGDDGDYPYTAPVGSFAANGYGLHDAAGNLWEWCWDWYGSYAAGPQADPRGPAAGTDRVYRGGNWFYYADHCRASYRASFPPTFSSYLLGFRPARSVAP